MGVAEGAEDEGADDEGDWEPVEAGAEVGALDPDEAGADEEAEERAAAIEAVFLS